MKKIYFFKTLLLTAVLFGSVNVCGQTPFTMSLTMVNRTKLYTENFVPTTPAYYVPVSSSDVILQDLTSEVSTNSYLEYSGWNNQENYFCYSITAAEGYNLEITTINSNLRSANAGPKYIAVETSTSLSGIWTVRATSSLTGTTAGDADATGLNIIVNAGETLYIRYRNTSVTSANGGTVTAAGTGRLNSGSVAGTFVVAPPSCTPSPVLTADNTDNTLDNDLTITFADNETWREAVDSIKIDGVKYTTGYTLDEGTLTINQGVITTIGPKTIVVFATGYCDATVEQEVLAGTAPVISVLPAALSGFTYEEGGESAEKTFTVSGSNLTEDITITAPENYLISTTSGSDFGTSIVLIPEENSVSETVYVILKSGLSIGNYNGEEISITSTEVAEQTVTCSGSVTPAYIAGGKKTYELVTSTDDLVLGGKYLIVSRGTDGDGFALGSQNASPLYRNRAAITVEDNKIKNITTGTGDLPFEITLKSVGDDWVLYDAVNDQNLVAEGTNNLITLTSDESIFTISFGLLNSAIITCLSPVNTGSYNVIRCNSSRFACFQSSNGNDVYLYKQACPSIIFDPPTLSLGNVTVNEKKTVTVNVKAENLVSNITVGYSSDIFVDRITTVLKADAEDDNGFDLDITVKPTNINPFSESITFNYTIPAECSGGGGLSLEGTAQEDGTVRIDNVSISRLIYAHSQEVIFTATAGEVVNIYNAVGQSLVSVLAQDGENRISVPYTGVAIVRIGETAAKVVLK